MMKILVFDMDGTIADLYSVDSWLSMLKDNSTLPYEVANPLYDMQQLNECLNSLKLQGWKIVVTSWLAKNSTEEYKERTRIAKKSWLDRYNFPYDEIHLVQYGTTKADCTRKYGKYQILIDDNEKIRKGWNLGSTINAKENILIQLTNLLSMSID